MPPEITPQITTRMRPVAHLKIGDAVGSVTRLLYVLVSNAETTPAGTVKAKLAFDPPPGGAEPRVEDREWLHADCLVSVRERR